MFTGYVSLFAFGLPLIYVLRRIGLLSLPFLTISGALAGAVVFVLYAKLFAFLLESSAPFDPLQILWGAALGFSVAILFGLIAGVPLMPAQNHKNQSQLK